MIRLILDTDLAMGAAGSDIDDGFALAYTVADPDIDLIAVTTVNGNTDVESATILSLELLERLGAPGIPVYKGASEPLTREIATTDARRRAEEVRQRFGGRGPAVGIAADQIIRLVRENPDELVIAAIGPLTNIALALKMAPDIAPLIRELVIMGGVFLEHTNQREMPGEFNIWVDPDAAQIVMESGIRIRLVGLDVTRKVRLSRADADLLELSASPFANFAGESTRAWIDFISAKNPGDPLEQDSCAMHDPLAVAVITKPDLVEWVPAHVDFETKSDLTRGVAVADLLTSVDAPTPNCYIAADVDADLFRNVFLDRIQSL